MKADILCSFLLRIFIYGGVDKTVSVCYNTEKERRNES